MTIDEARALITQEDWDWFWSEHDREGWECSRCGGEGFIEYNDAPDLWGEDCPSEVNHLVDCPECHRIEIEKLRIILRHKGLLPQEKQS